MASTYSPFQTITGRPVKNPFLLASGAVTTPTRPTAGVGIGAGSPAAQTVGRVAAAGTAPAGAANSAQTLATVAPGNANGAAAPARPAAPSLDYSSDPVLAQIRLLGQEAVPNALADADAAKKALLVQYGDPNVARHAIFGGKGFNLPGIAGGPDFTVADTTHTGDENTAAAAEKNPFSVLARLLHTHQQQGDTIDQGLNDQGLYFSGARVKALQEEQRAYQQDQADAYTQLAQALAGIDSGVGQAYQTEGARQMQGEQEAYLRALAAAAQNPPGSGGGGSGDGGGDGGPAGPGQSTPDASASSTIAPALAHYAAYLGHAPVGGPTLGSPRSMPNAYNRRTVANLR